MKPISFLRKTLRKRENKPSSKAPTSVEPFLLEVAPASPFLKSGFAETTAVLSLEFESTLQGEPVVENHIESWESIHARVVPRLRGKHGSLFQSGAHGPPQNASHGPAVLDFGSYSFGSKVAPRRPPRPPSLDLASPPPSPTQRSPTRVKFAPEPRIRMEQPFSPLRRTFLRAEEQSSGSISSDSPQVLYQDNQDPEANTSIGRSSNTFECCPLAESTSTAHAVLDFSDSPNTKTFIRTSSSSPHLPLAKTRPQTEPQSRVDNLRSPPTSHDTLASFPLPPPLRYRKRPQPLVLFPTPSTTQLPSSPLVGSVDSSLLATSPNASPLSSPKSPKFGRSLRTVTPPRYSPPNSPLPSPPVPSAFLAPPGIGNHLDSGKTLRTSQSVSRLRDHRFEAPYYQVHRATSSAPTSDIFIGDETKRVESVPVSELGYPSLEPTERHDILLERPSELYIQWGYAL